MYLVVYIGPRHWARGGTNILIKIKRMEIVLIKNKIKQRSNIINKSMLSV